MNRVRIAHNEERHRYELSIDDDLVSYAEYASEPDRLVFDHTETLDDFRGLGLAARVVAFALDDVRKRGLSVVPACWFVADFIDAHPEYRDLVAGKVG